METRPVPLKVLMPHLERMEPAVLDSSNRKIFSQCPKKYFFKVVLAMKENNINKNYPMFFGTCYHKFREVIEREYAENRQSKVGDDLFNHCLQIGLIVMEKMWKGDPALGTKYDYLTKARLQKSCIYGFEYWKKEKIQNQIEVIAPEQPFDILLKDGKTRSGGKLDQIIKIISRPTIRDFKTTSKAKERYEFLINPADQFSAYIHAGTKLMSGDLYTVKIEILYNTKKEGPIIYELTTTRTDTQLARWENNVITLEELISICREKDTWPENTEHCPWCEYHMVCKLPSIDAQASKLQSAFKVEPWDFKKQEEAD